MFKQLGLDKVRIHSGEISIRHLSCRSIYQTADEFEICPACQSMYFFVFPIMKNVEILAYLDSKGQNQPDLQSDHGPLCSLTELPERWMSRLIKASPFTYAPESFSNSITFFYTVIFLDEIKPQK